MLKKISFTVLFFLILNNYVFAQNDVIKKMIVDVTYLASDSLEGRATGEQGEKLAAQYIEKKFIEYGLIPKGDQMYYQYFKASIKSNPHSIAPARKIDGINVIGYLDHSKDETIVIGAHYDHLGYGISGSLHSGEREIHNGADDNASGVSIMINLINELKGNKSYNYLFIAFSGEEHGLFGSSFYAKNPTINLSNVRFMLNFDMVGRLNDQKDLAINGVATSNKWKDLLSTSNKNELKLKMSDSGIGPSDHTSFYFQDIPVLHFFTGQHSDYHKPTDDVEKVNFKGMYLIMRYVEEIIRKSAYIEDFDFQETASDSLTVPKFTVTLGVMPDYLYDGLGLRIDGVTKGKTAFKHGIQKGDVVIRMGNTPVSDIMTYMKALSKYKSGEKTDVVIRRLDTQITVNIVFD